MSSMAYLDRRLWTYRDSGSVRRTTSDHVRICHIQTSRHRFIHLAEHWREDGRHIKGEQVCEGGLTPPSPTDGREEKS
jgi:hypothetical protein